MITNFLGRLHPLVVHLPIGIYVLVFIFQYFTPKRLRENRKVISLMLLCGAVFSVLAALFGWLLSLSGDFSENALFSHKWFGIVFSLVASFLFGLHQWLINNSRTLKTYHAFFMLTMVLMTITGHFGGNLTHGEGYLSAVQSSDQNKKIQRSNGLLLPVSGSAIALNDSLPVVPMPDSKAIIALKKAGFTVNPISLGSGLLHVSAINMQEIKFDDLKLLSPLAQNIYWLELPDKNISDQAMTHVSFFVNLTKLDLKNTKITGAIAKDLVKLQSLEYINLVGTGFDDNGLIEIRGMKKLEHVYCWGSRVTEKGIFIFNTSNPAQVNIGASP